MFQNKPVEQKKDNSLNMFNTNTNANNDANKQA